MIVEINKTRQNKTKQNGNSILVCAICSVARNTSDAEGCGKSIRDCSRSLKRGLTVVYYTQLPSIAKTNMQQTCQSKRLDGRAVADREPTNAIARYTGDAHEEFCHAYRRTGEFSSTACMHCRLDWTGRQHEEVKPRSSQSHASEMVFTRACPDQRKGTQENRDRQGKVGWGIEVTVSASHRVRPCRREDNNQQK